MAFVTHTRLVNPRLGTYYGIFAGGVAALFLTLLILEQLGAGLRILSTAMLVGPIALVMVIGAMAWTAEPLEYFAGGRRVPAVFSGLVLAMTAYGATGIVVLAGALFTVGFDALFLAIGGIAGFVVMATALAPYLRKVGAFTLPSYLGRRLDSKLVRLVAAAVMAVPVILVLAAEIRIAARVAGWLTGRPIGLMLVLMVAVVLATVVLGGMRSLTWSSVAQAIVALLALTVPVAIVAVFETNMPVPQLSHGPTLRALGRAEIDQGLAAIQAAPLGVDLPGQGLQAMSKRFASAFGNVGSLAFTLLSLTVMAGVAAAPWLLPRVGTVPNVHDTRRSIGWAAFVFGLVMMTVAAVAVFARDALMDVIAAGKTQDGVYWLQRLGELGWVQTPATGQRATLANLLVERDAVLFVLPVSAGLPVVMLHLTLAGVIAAALAAAATTAVTLGNILAEDVVNGHSWEPPANAVRLLVARIAFAAATIAGGAVALIAPADPLDLLLWALILVAATSFPVLLLSVWWKRLNGWGAMMGLAAGFGVAILAILACEGGVLPFDSALAAVPAMPAAFAAAMVASYLTPAPDRNVLEITRDLRMPGGETVFDREMRLLRLKQRQRT